MIIQRRAKVSRASKNEEIMKALEAGGTNLMGIDHRAIRLFGI